VTFIVASTGKGKTWFLINAAKSGLQHHHSVLYLTLELAEEKIAKRLLQCLFSLTASEVQEIRIPIFERSGPDGLYSAGISVQFANLQRDSVFERRKDLGKKLADMISYPPLLIKEFPTSMLTLSDLSYYLDTLKREEGFEPDILALDYPELMNLDAANLRLDIGQLWRGLRGLAGSRNLALIAASQGNRDSEEARTVRTTHAAEDWSKVGTADTIYCYSQTPAEYKLGLSRIAVAKARDAADRFTVLNSQAYAIGQFSLDSVIMRASLVDELAELTGEKKESA
jgi:replicative DNA helicase